jgi:hypothetical protein
MNRKALLAKALFLVTACLAFSAVSLRAQTFIFNPQDLVLAFRQSGGASDLVVDIGQASAYYGASGGSSFTIGQYNASQLSSAFSSLDNLSFSVSGAVRTSGDPVNPLQTLWVTDPRVDINTQSSPWQRQSQFSQGTVGGQIVGIGNGAVTYGGTQPAGPNNTASAVVIPDSDPNSYHSFMGDSGDFNGTFQGNAENTTGLNFTTSGSPLVSDLYQLRPGSGDSTLLGQFQFNTDGTMTFTAVPEPSIWALLPLGALMFVCMQRLRRAN